MVAESPTILQSLGIGSCVVVCIYDRKNKVGGLAHIMSPKNKIGKDVKPMRFANKAIRMMLEGMKTMGATTSLTAKIIGGAAMFPKITHFLTVGNENIIAVRTELIKLKIRVVKEDIGSSQGRSVWFDTSNGDVVVSKIKGETKVI